MNDTSPKTTILPGSKIGARPEGLLRIEAQGNYSFLIHYPGQKTLYSFTILRYQNALPGFLRVHKQHLIDPTYAVAIRRNGPTDQYIRMADDTLIPISRRRLKATLTHLKHLSHESI